MVSKTDQLIEHLFREEYGKLVASLTRFFGASNISLAEDIVQETLIAASEHWSVREIPDNPTGWLVQVAKRKALNELKRNKVIQRHGSEGHLTEATESEIGTIFLDNEIKDNQLRMMFTCCHPGLATKSQIALTLKTLCGFGIKEVASALLTNESTINKRLYRAKSDIRDLGAAFDIPQGKELKQRLETVNLTLYLLFNEGYNSTSNDSIIQKEMCLEAIRLTKLLCEHFPEHKKSFALLSLMYFHAARFEARIDDKGTIVLFEDQDRSEWSKDLISLGMGFLQKSIDSSLSSYHIEAGIAAEHCMAESFETTDWQSIFNQYKLLEKVKPNPIIKLNLAIIQSKLEGIEASLAQLDLLTQDKILSTYHLLPATQGIFHMKIKNYQAAIDYLEKAASLGPSDSECRIIESRIAECRKKLNRST
ncbi:MAG: sigma-70 family RNA polymerase sigma factor [Cyclobacteriaceae bacterium]